MRRIFCAISVLACLVVLVSGRAADDLPRMKFNEVKEIAPGVFFRYSSIGPEGSNIAFGGSNHVWIVFEDYVVVIDANFPKEAGDVVEAIKKTTDKPIRYVLDTHHHGDHAYGNAVFATAGASIVAHSACSRWLREKGFKEFEDAGKGPQGRKDIRESKLKVPNVVFDDKLVLDDGKQRVEFLWFGHAHTPGDALAYLPKHTILCTGDACLNGPYNYMGQSDSASWIRVLERCQQLDVKIVAPGHGPLAGKELLEKQKRYFIELRQQVQKGIDAGRDLDDIIKDIRAPGAMPWYKEWTTVPPAGDNIKHVYAELTGKITPVDLTADFGIYEGPSPTKKDKDWTRPRRIVVPAGLMPAKIAELKRVAPEIEFTPAKTAADAVKVAGDADAIVGFCTPEIVKAGKNLRWVQVGSAGVETYLFPEMAASKIVLTNTQRLYGPNVADQAFALLLSLTRGLREVLPTEVAEMAWLKPKGQMQELHGKTMLVVGLGGIGTHLARRANGFGMRVMAIDPKDMERPDFVFSLAKPDKLLDLLPRADVVVLACPLTAETKGLIGSQQLKAMKPSAYLINIARGGIVQTPALVEALENKQIAGAGLDVTDPEPLPDRHPLWKLSNCVISPHVGGQSPEAMDRQWRLWRENVRRFAAGEPLLCVVDKAKGY
jgi:phosphoglycerate dehydrogenase-like enzyme/glyoxylase-like metal-dependent hydrolase (beta-lactamase superfamily II)